MQFATLASPPHRAIQIFCYTYANACEHQRKAYAGQSFWRLPVKDRTQLSPRPKQPSNLSVASGRQCSCHLRAALFDCHDLPSSHHCRKHSLH